MADVNFYGAAVSDYGSTPGDIVTPVNSYMGQAVVSDYWANGKDTCMEGSVLKDNVASTATYNWADFNAPQATVTTVQETIFNNAISDDNFGGSRGKTVVYDKYGNIVAETCDENYKIVYDETGNIVNATLTSGEDCKGIDNHIWHKGNASYVVKEETAEEPEEGAGE